MISYASVPLTCPLPEHLALLRGQQDPSWLPDLAHASWPGADRTRYPWPGLCRWPPLRPQTLYWPTGASRWAVAYLLVSADQMVRVAQAIYSQSGSAYYQPADLVLDDGRAANALSAGTLTVSMYALPPRPVWQVAGGDPLYLLTLVDARYFWHERPGSLTVADGVTAWQDLYDALGTLLGVTLSVETVDYAYLLPGGDLTAYYQDVPAVLDAVAYNTGRRVVRNLDGTVSVQGPAAALDNTRYQVGVGRPKFAGGLFLFDPAAPANDLTGLLPSQVTVAFARSANTFPAVARYPLSATLAGLASPGLGGARGHPGTKWFRSARVATFAAPGDASPSNATALQGYVNRLAADWYAWRVGPCDLKLAGIVPWAPDGLADHVLWTHDGGECSTRVVRGPFNDQAEDLLGGPGPSRVTVVTCVGGTSASRVSLDLPAGMAVSGTVCDPAPADCCSGSGSGSGSGPGGGLDCQPCGGRVVPDTLYARVSNHSGCPGFDCPLEFGLHRSGSLVEVWMGGAFLPAGTDTPAPVAFGLKFFPCGQCPGDFNFDLEVSWCGWSDGDFCPDVATASCDPVYAKYVVPARLPYVINNDGGPVCGCTAAGTGSVLVEVSETPFAPTPGCSSGSGGKTVPCPDPCAHCANGAAPSAWTTGVLSGFSFDAANGIHWEDLNGKTATLDQRVGSCEWWMGTPPAGGNNPVLKWVTGNVWQLSLGTGDATPGPVDALYRATFSDCCSPAVFTLYQGTSTIPTGFVPATITLTPSGGCCGVTVPCCVDPLPGILYATMVGAGCPCMGTQTVPLLWNGAAWASAATAFGTCGSTITLTVTCDRAACPFNPGVEMGFNLHVHVTGPGGCATTEDHCDGSPSGSTCSPLALKFNWTGVSAACCPGVGSNQVVITVTT